LSIPISLDPVRRPQIRQVVLFVSTDEGKSWGERERVSPDKDAFSFNAPDDGIYWFSVAVDDLQGKRDPPSPYPPAPAVLKTLTEPGRPECRVQSAERSGDDIIVRGDARDPYLDPAATRVEYHPADALPHQWTAAPLNPATPNQATFRP